MLHMEDVRRVMRPKVMGNIREKARRFIACRLNDLTVQTRKRRFHEGMPRVLIAGWGHLLQDNVVALGVHGHQAQPAGKRFILGQRDGLSGHVFGQTRAFLSAVRHDGLLHLTVDLVLRPFGQNIRRSSWIPGSWNLIPSIRFRGRLVQHPRCRQPCS